MTTEAIQRSIFKMNPEYWQQRMPGTNGMAQSPEQTAPNPSPTDDVKFSQMKEFTENYSYSPKYEKYQEVDMDPKPRSSPTEVAQNLSSDGFGYKSQSRTPEMSPQNSILQNLSPEQLRNIQSTLANMSQTTTDARNLQANAVQNLSTHIQNVLTPNALSPAEIRNLQSLAISNLSTQVQTITNANLSLTDIRNLTTIAVQNLTNHIENLRNQSANLTPNEVRNLTSVAVQNLTNHIQNLSHMSQPQNNELQRNIAAFQQLTNPNFSAMQNLSSLSGMSNNIAAVSAVLSAAAAQQAALSGGGGIGIPPPPVPQPESTTADGAEPEASNGSNSGGPGSNGPSGSAGSAAATALVPLGSGSNSNADKLTAGDSSQSRNSAISNQTLEECWSTLQRIFMHKSAMQMHARDLQTKPHQCQQCLKSFSSNHQLVQHIRVHTGEKPYKCSYCDRRFKQLSHVQQHTRLHTGERPYRCHLPECGRAFIQLSNLQQHLRNHDAQVERAKNRPFHCNICGKGFATESSLRTHTSKEQREALLGIPLTSLEPRHNEMSQLGNAHNNSPATHASLLAGNQNAVTCPLCHKLFLGGENLMEHMKHTHKDPNASGVAREGPETNLIFSHPTGSYLAKRRTANHPCPICGKHYVNEGSLRKHLACHPETAQLSSSLRMWPCSVCQAVFTHESGLLSHMEHMRMDPKHQFAAQYVLSRAAAERRERESLLAAAAAVNVGGFGLGGQGGNSMCPSPAPSDSSSIEHLSSTGSDTGGNIPNNNNNTKVDLSHISPNMATVRATTPTPMEYSDIPNRMAALNAIVQAQNLHQDPEQVQQQQQSHQQSDKFMEQIAPSNLIMRNTPPNENNNDPVQSQIDIKPDVIMPPRTDLSPAQAQQLAVNAMRANLENMRNIESLAGIRSGYMDGPMGNHQQQSDNVFRIQQQAAEVLLRTQAEAALRLAVSQAAAAASGDRAQNNLHSQLSPDLTEALRLQEQRLEQALRLHGDPRVLGFSLNAATAAAANAANVTNTPVNSTPTPNNT